MSEENTPIEHRFISEGKNSPSESKSWWSRMRKDHRLFSLQYFRFRKILMIGVSILVFTNSLEIVLPLLLKFGIDAVIDDESWWTVFWLGFLYLIIVLVQSVLRYYWRMFVGGASMESAGEMRSRLAKKLLSLSPSFFDRRRSGDLITLMSNDLEAVRMTLGPGTVMATDAFFFVLTIPIVMFLMAPELALYALAPMLFIPFFVWWNRETVLKRFEKVQESFSKLSALAQENLVGIRLIKAYARENAQIARFRREGEIYMERNIDLAKVQVLFGPFLDSVMSLGVIALLYFGGQMVLQDALTVGTFVAFYRYLHRLIWPMSALGLAVSVYQRGVASSRRVLEVHDEELLVVEKRDATVAAKENPAGLRIKDLSFSYPGHENRPVLENINLEVERGQTVALVGMVGSGKSTLLKLIPRLYPVPSGHIFLNGLDVNHWRLGDLRNEVATVFQDCFLFSQSVEQNLRFGSRTDHLPEPSEIQSAVEITSIHDEIKEFPQGFSTVVGERGINLSGGQRQRVTIARALIRQSGLLVLDDSLASVDVLTESKLIKNLAKIQDETAILIAAHRISTIQNADRVYVFHEGKIVEEGVHQKLIQSKGLYQRFYDQQRLKEDLEHYVREISP